MSQFDSQLVIVSRSKTWHSDSLRLVLDPLPECCSNRSTTLYGAFHFVREKNKDLRLQHQISSCRIYIFLNYIFCIEDSESVFGIHPTFRRLTNLVLQYSHVRSVGKKKKQGGGINGQLHDTGSCLHETVQAGWKGPRLEGQT